MGIEYLYQNFISPFIPFYIKKWQGYVGTHPTFCYQDYLPDVTYEERLAHLSIPVLNDFIFECCEVHLNKISKDVNHPLYSRIVFNNLKMSFREKNVSSRFRPAIARTQKRARSFFQFFMQFFNNKNICTE